jgi:hypothetical protein
MVEAEKFLFIGNWGRFNRGWNPTETVGVKIDG